MLVWSWRLVRSALGRPLIVPTSVVVASLRNGGPDYHRVASRRIYCHSELYGPKGQSCFAFAPRTSPTSAVRSIRRSGRVDPSRQQDACALQWGGLPHQRGPQNFYRTAGASVGNMYILQTLRLSQLLQTPLKRYFRSR